MSSMSYLNKPLKLKKIIEVKDFNNLKDLTAKLLNSRGNLATSKDFEFLNSVIKTGDEVKSSDMTNLKEIIYKIQIFDEGKIVKKPEGFVNEYYNNITKFNLDYDKKIVEHRKKFPEHSSLKGDLIKEILFNFISKTLSDNKYNCSCNCNYSCTCNCNYCTCQCNYSCTCQCNYSSCACQCNYNCTCNCNYACTCHCNYAGSGVDYRKYLCFLHISTSKTICTCQCNYSCTCQCNYGSNNTLQTCYLHISNNNKRFEPYCSCQCNYSCTCQCNYGCTCNCNYKSGGETWERYRCHSHGGEITFSCHSHIGKQQNQKLPYVNLSKIYKHNKAKIDTEKGSEYKCNTHIMPKIGQVDYCISHTIPPFNPDATEFPKSTFTE